MTDPKPNQIRVKDKQQAPATAERTRPGRVFSPEVDIFETDTEITLVADVPGVTSQDLTIDLRDSILTINANGAVVESAGEQGLIVEFEPGSYYRQFSLPEVIDQEKIQAQLNQGVLRLTLSKVAKATPRRIAVTS